MNSTINRKLTFKCSTKNSMTTSNKTIDLYDANLLYPSSDSASPSVSNSPSSIKRSPKNLPSSDVDRKAQPKNINSNSNKSEP